MKETKYVTPILLLINTSNLILYSFIICIGTRSFHSNILCIAGRYIVRKRINIKKCPLAGLDSNRWHRKWWWRRDIAQEDADAIPIRYEDGLTDLMTCMLGVNFQCSISQIGLIMHIMYPMFIFEISIFCGHLIPCFKCKPTFKSF